MKSLRLYVHLLKFHALSLPWFLWALLLFLSLILGGVQWILRSGNADTTLNSGDNLFSMVYFFILAAQLSWGMGFGCSSAAQAQSWVTGSQEFLWTRAVNRDALFWAKLTVFAALCSLVWINTSLPNLVSDKPVRVSLYGGPQDRDFEAALLRTSSLSPRRIAEGSNKGKSREIVELGRGAVVLAGLTAWKVTAIALSLMFFIAILRLKWPWLLGVFFGCLAVYLLIILGSLRWETNRVLDAFQYRNQFLVYANHMTVAWLVLALIAGGVVWQTRRRYLRPAR